MSEPELGYDDLFSDLEVGSDKTNSENFEEVLDEPTLEPSHQQLNQKLVHPSASNQQEQEQEQEVSVDVVKEESSSSSSSSSSSEKRVEPKPTTNKRQKVTSTEGSIGSKPTLTVDNSNLVAEHYNLLQPIGRKERNQSSIIRLRSFNNWLKSVLIKNYCKPNDVVLELGVGKGGDLKKFAKSHIKFLVGADIAAVSIEQAKSRFENMHPSPYQAQFLVHDCYGEVIRAKLPADFCADVVSLQFCMHYAFESQQKVETMLRNVSENLKLGGKLIATIPNANFLVKKLRSSSTLKFGNPIYDVQFQTRERKLVYGDTYTFNLAEAIDNCPEYLIHLPSFLELAKKYRLKLIFKQDFHTFFETYRKIPKFNDLLYKMKVVGDESLPKFSKDEWEAAGLYLAIAFEKVGPMEKEQ